ncbi:transmembrane protein 132A [Apteryx rowi]|uniref:transmembrane protein 132A n=1 Tax=Apteryx rowi TaxID=308060 RepID=UPI000E1C940A|nr:transmembrane protein 132A [Apteryx rowi]
MASGDADPPDPVYLPAHLEVLDVPEYYRLQRADRDLPANASLRARSETYLLLRHGAAPRPLVRAAYAPFSARQAVPAESPPRQEASAGWSIRAVPVESAASPAQPFARVLFHLQGPDWLPGRQEVRLDDKVLLRVPEAALRPGQLFTATLVLRHNFTADQLTLRVKAKKGLQVVAARPAAPAAWAAQLERSRGAKHSTAVVTCRRRGAGGRWPARAAEGAELLHLDLAVENGTGGAAAAARPVTWQVEYPGQDAEAQKDKMVWEIQVSERDIRALVPLAQPGGSPLLGAPTPGAALPRKEGGAPGGGRRKRVEFVTFAPPRAPEEPPLPASNVQSILVASEDDIRWVCEDMGLRDPEELRSYMERIRGSS